MTSYELTLHSQN